MVPAGKALTGVATVPLGVAGSYGMGPWESADGPSWSGVGLDMTDGASSGEAGGIKAIGAGVFMGEGLPPVPCRLADRIRRWEFIEMFELLPKLLADPKGGKSGVKQPSRARGCKRVQDVSVWLQCFAAFIGLVAKSSPEAVPALMAYMISIIRASQEYEGSAWAAYDAAFRRQAAATGQRDWEKINSSLYTICCMGKARRAQRCNSCLSAAHTTSECYSLGEEEPDMAGRVRAV